MQGNHTEIRILPDEVINKIAAGEVVERPASIVKELIENSLDAGSTQIHLEVLGSGRALIRVEDNGSGMTRHDLLQAIERHATSKLRKADDLKEISTFGFRGEALPSIASVSRFRIVSGKPGETPGTELFIEGGKLKSVQDSPPVPGTTVVVKDLFFNTPARKKFLRSPTTEFQHILDKFIQQALAYPEVQFRLTHDRKRVMDLLSTTDRRGRVEALLSRTAASDLIEIEPYSQGPVRVTGFTSRPTYTRSNWGHQYFYVNGRYVKDRVIGRAVMESYRSMLPRGRYPVVILFLTIDSGEVDVNVHPAKSEVRFTRPDWVYQTVFDALRLTLEGHRYAVSLAEPDSPHPPPGSLEPVGERRTPRVYSPIPPPPSQQAPPNSKSEGENRYRPLTNGAPAPLRTEVSGKDPVFPGVSGEPKRVQSPMRFTEIDGSFSDRLHPLGQAFKTFIVLEDEDRLLFLDQHTAHERVLYEKFTRKYREKKVDRQELLFPVNLELSKKDSNELRERLSILNDLGFEIEPFGGETFIVRSVPSLLIGQDPRGIITDVIEKSAQVGGKVTFDQLIEEMILIFSCRGAVKANQTLDKREILTLLHELEKATLPYSCPHGRPIALSLEKKELDKGFFRI